MGKISIEDLLIKIGEVNKKDLHFVDSNVSFDKGDLRKNLIKDYVRSIDVKPHDYNKEVTLTKNCFDNLLYFGVNGSFEENLFLSLDYKKIDLELREEDPSFVFEVLNGLWNHGNHKYSRGVAAVGEFMTDYQNVFGDNFFLKKILDYLEGLCSNCNRRPFQFPRSRVENLFVKN